MNRRRFVTSIIFSYLGISSDVLAKIIDMRSGTARKSDNEPVALLMLDLTGKEDMTNVISQYLKKNGRIHLPDGIIKANISIPSNGSISGAGQKKFDHITSQWSGSGTLILGTLDLSESVGFSVAHLSIDSYDTGRNSIQAIKPISGKGRVMNVSTRANNHGQLWEANDDNAQNVNAIGDVLIKDCTHFGGPNGFVTKHKNITFVRCHAFDVSVQAFVIASDNINGSRKFSRATETTLVDCYAERCNECIRIYSRGYYDNFSVIGVDRTNVRTFRCKNITGRQLRIGDFDIHASDFKRIVNSRTSITDMLFHKSLYSSVFISFAKYVVFYKCGFGSWKNISLGGEVTKMRVLMPIVNT